MLPDRSFIDEVEGWGYAALCAAFNGEVADCEVVAIGAVIFAVCELRPPFEENLVGIALINAVVGDDSASFWSEDIVTLAACEADIDICYATCSEIRAGGAEVIC